MCIRDSTRSKRELGLMRVVSALAGVRVCVTTKKRHLIRLGQISEFEQESNTESQQESDADSHSARDGEGVCYNGDKASRPAWPAR